jgi:hypothetical protein
MKSDDMRQLAGLADMLEGWLVDNGATLENEIAMTIDGETVKMARLEDEDGEGGWHLETWTA